MVFLANKNLIVGSNNASTTVSGLIRDGDYLGGSNQVGASLTKTGSGTLTLSGSNSVGNKDCKPFHPRTC